MSYKPDNMPSLIPYLTVRTAEESIDFYKRAFGFSLMAEPAVQDGKIVHAELILNDTVIMLAPEGAWGDQRKAPISMGTLPSLFLYVYVPNVNDFYINAKQNGAVVLSEPANRFWGDRFCQLIDIDGYQWSFATKVAEHA